MSLLLDKVSTKWVGFYATKKNLFIDRYIMINEDMELFEQWINTK